MRFFLSLWLLLLLALGCSPSPMVGKTPEPSHRIVSLSPNLTDLICAIGAGGRVVGTCAPRGSCVADRKIPAVASYGYLDVERIVELEPSACVTVSGMHPAGQVDDLRRLGVRVVEYRLDTLEELWRCIGDLGALAGMPREGEALAATLKDRVAIASRAARSLPPVSGAVVVGINPLVFAGSGTFIDDVIESAGIQNVFSGSYSGFPTLSEEVLISKRPRCLVFPDGDIGRRDVDRLAALAGGSEAGITIYAVPADALSRPGTGTADAVELLVKLRVGKRDKDGL